MACEVMLDRLRRIRNVLKECIMLVNEEHYGLLHEKCVEKLRELGLLCGDDSGILDDPYFDKQCIGFVLKVIRKIFEDYRDR